MNEKEAEEQGTFLKGAIGALETLASDIEDVRLDAHVLEMNLVARRREAHKIRDQIKAYFGTQDCKDTSGALTEEEMKEIADEEHNDEMRFPEEIEAEKEGK